jgi:hypothetical protein
VPHRTTETWSVSPSVDLPPPPPPPPVVTIPATVPQRSEIPEGLMNYPVLLINFYMQVMNKFKRKVTRLCIEI